MVKCLGWHEETKVLQPNGGSPNDFEPVILSPTVKVCGSALGEVGWGRGRGDAA